MQENWIGRSEGTMVAFTAETGDTSVSSNWGPVLGAVKYMSGTAVVSWILALILLVLISLKWMMF